MDLEKNQYAVWIEIPDEASINKTTMEKDPAYCDYRNQFIENFKQNPRSSWDALYNDLCNSHVEWDHTKSNMDIPWYPWKCIRDGEKHPGSLHTTNSQIKYVELYEPHSNDKTYLWIPSGLLGHDPVMIRVIIEVEFSFPQTSRLYNWLDGNHGFFGWPTFRIPGTIPAISEQNIFSPLERAHKTFEIGSSDKKLNIIVHPCETLVKNLNKGIDEDGVPIFEHDMPIGMLYLETKLLTCNWLSRSQFDPFFTISRHHQSSFITDNNPENIREYFSHYSCYKSRSIKLKPLPEVTLNFTKHLKSARSII